MRIHTEMRYAIRRYATTRYAFVLGSVLLFQACSSDAPSVIAPQTDPSHIFGGVRLSDHFVLLGPSAPYDTLTLSAVAYDGNGKPLANAATPTYQSSDTNSVTVSANGLVHGKSPGAAATVSAQMTIGNVTFADTVIVQVATGQPSVTTFSAAPPPPDSAKRSVGNWGYNANVDGTNLTNMQVYYETANPLIVAFGYSGSPQRAVLGSPNSLYVGILANVPATHAMIYISATVAGVRYRDSVDFTVGWPSQGGFFPTTITKRDGSTIYMFSPSLSTIGTGATVSWTLGAIPYSIVFNDPSAVKADPGSSGPGNVDGNIAQWKWEGNFWTDYSRSRMFPKPGTYTFTSPELGAGGTIVVVDDRPCAPNCP